MARPFNCHSPTAEAWVLSQAIPCRIYDALCGTGEFFFSVLRFHVSLCFQMPPTDAYHRLPVILVIDSAIQ